MITFPLMREHTPDPGPHTESEQFVLAPVKGAHLPPQQCIWFQVVLGVVLLSWQQ